MSWAWMSDSDWTDFTIERLRWRLDLDKKHRFLEPWQRNVIFSVFREAKERGLAFRFEGKRRQQVRDILSTHPVAEDLIE